MSSEQKNNTQHAKQQHPADWQQTPHTMSAATILQARSSYPSVSPTPPYRLGTLPFLVSSALAYNSSVKTIAMSFLTGQARRRPQLQLQIGPQTNLC